MPLPRPDAKALSEELEQGGSNDSEDPSVPSDPLPGEDEGNGGQTGNDENGGQNGGDEQTDDDENGGDPEPETPITPGSHVSQASTGADYYWWYQTKNGGEGAWKASVSYENTWIRHQYLTLEVTRVDEKGRTTVTTVKDFYVPANGKSTFELWDNASIVNKGNVKGVMSYRSRSRESGPAMRAGRL